MAEGGLRRSATVRSMSEPYPFRPDLPRHAQISAVLRERIESGELQPRRPLPSEAHLQQEFGVARDTIRRALQTLQDEGLVRVVVGLGRFVADRSEADSD